MVGCPPDDCANREGNLWAERRLTRRRVPRLKKAYANAPITAAWLPPNDLALAVLPTDPPLATAVSDESGAPAEPDYLSARRMYQRVTWRNLLPTFALLAVALAIQIFATNVLFRPDPAPPAMVQIILPDPGQPLQQLGIDRLATDPIDLRLEMDGRLVFEGRYEPGELFTGQADPVFAEFELEPGQHDFDLTPES